MANSPTSHSLAHLRNRGFLVDACERWIPHTTPPIRKDLFGAFDLVALHLDVPGILGVQTTSLSNLPARVAKLRALPALEVWLKCGNRVELHGWARRGRKWEPKVVELRAEDMAPVVVRKPTRRLAQRHRQGELFSSEAADPSVDTAGQEAA